MPQNKLSVISKTQQSPFRFLDSEISKIKGFFPLILFMAVTLFLSNQSFSQCTSGYTQSFINWDLQYTSGGMVLGTTGTRFAIGVNDVVIKSTGTVTSISQNNFHTGNGGISIAGNSDITANYDAEFDVGAGTITFTFTTEVRNLTFTVQDIDQGHTVNFTAVDAAAVADTINLTTFAGNVLTITNNNTTSASARGVGGNTSPTLNTASVTVLVTRPVKTLTLTITKTGGGTGSLFLSDIRACILGAHPLNYQAIGSPESGQPEYFMFASSNNLNIVNSSTGAATLLYTDGSLSGSGINSLAYDPYNQVIYYTSEQNTGANKAVYKYDIKTDAKTTWISDVTASPFNIELSATKGLGSGAATFYNGSFYLGVEANTGAEEGGTYRIDLDAAGNAVRASRVFILVGDYNLGFGDFVANDTILYVTDASTTTFRVLNLDNQTQTNSYSGYFSQLSLASNGTIRYIDNTVKFASYTGSGTWGSTTTVTGYTGTVTNDASEVFKYPSDYGDAPSSYGVTYHDYKKPANLNIKLGSAIDFEVTTSASTTTNLDDSTNTGSSDDEDAVSSFSSLNAGNTTYAVTVAVTNSSGAVASLYGWIDFNRNGVFESGERIGASGNVANGATSVTLTWTGLSGLVVGKTYVRFRIGSVNSEVNTPTGRAADGEVEDYNLLITYNISGTIYNDRGGLTDGVINGTVIGNPSSTQLYANLVDSVTNIVRFVQSVNTITGVYAFNSLDTIKGYKLVISTTQGTVGLTSPSSTLPATWVNIGDNFGSGNRNGTGNQPGTSDGIIFINSTGSNVTGINFGIERLPTSTTKTAASQVNPGGTVTVRISSLAGSDPEDGSKGQGSSFKILTLPTKGILYYNGIAVTANQIITNYDSTLFRVDPTFNGSGSLNFTYSVVDSAGQTSTAAATITMPFTSLTMGGTVFSDRGGVIDGIINGSGLGNPSGTQLYANLIDSITNIVRAVATVNAGTGIYTISDSINANTGYKFIISTIQGTVGSSAPAATLPTNWGYVGDSYGTNNSNGSGIEAGTANGTIFVHTVTSNVATLNFGIEQLPTTTTKTASSQLNPGGTVTVRTPSLAGTDPEDGSKGQGGKFRILTLPVKGNLYYNGVAVTVNQTISNYDSTLLRVDPAFNGSGSISFTYSLVDSADQISTTPGTISMPFTSLTFNGNVYNDRGGVTDNTINGIGTGAPGGTQLYANLVDSITNIVRAVVSITAGSGAYTISDSINANTGYKLIISSVQGTVGSAAPAITLPSNWVNVGDAYGTNNTNGLGIEPGTANGSVFVHTVTSNVASLNFGIEQLPTTTSKTSASRLNQGASVAIQTPSFAGTDPDDGNSGQGNKFKILTLPTKGTLRYNGVPVVANQSISNYDSTLLTAVPNFNGSGTISFTYSVIDSAGQTSLTPGTMNMPFTSLAISGTVYNDGGGLIDGVINGSVIGNPQGSQLYVNLVDSITNIVRTVVSVNTGTGIYNITDSINANTGFRLTLSTVQGTVGSAAPAITLPAIWAYVGESYGTGNADGTGIEVGTPNGSVNVHTTTSNITGITYGIDKGPTADNKTYNNQDSIDFNVPSGNPTYPFKIRLSNASGTANGTFTGPNSSTKPGKVSGSDAEDGNYSGSNGTNGRRTFVVITPPNATNDILVYNNIELIASPTISDPSYVYWNVAAARYEITSFNDTLLSLYVKKNGHSTLTFSYAWRDSANVIGTTGSYTINSLTPIPVKLIGFDAVLNGNQVNLRWQTATELNTDHFEIERSTDGINFTTILSQPAAGNSTSMRRYTDTDVKIDLSNTNTLYYRLVTYDIDNSFSVSSVRAVSLNNSKSNLKTQTWPNPFNSELNVNVWSNINEKVLITLIDANGKEVFNEEIMLTKGDNNFKRTSFSALPAGSYTLVITNSSVVSRTHLIKVI